MRWPSPPRIPRPPGSDREIGWMVLLGHYMVPGYAVAVASEIAWDAAGQPGGALSLVNSVLWWAVLPLLLCEVIQHRWHLCERCARATPLDPERKVKHVRYLLRLTHAKSFFALWLAVVVFIIADNKTGSPGTLRYAADAAATAAILVLLFAAWQHNRLQPWCPYCRWGKGGEHETVPDPDSAVSL